MNKDKVNMDLRQIFRKVMQIMLPLTLGLVLLWYLYRNQDLSEMMQTIKKGVHYEIILYSLIFGLLANIIRGLRWNMLIDSLGKKIRCSNAIYAVLGSYAINMALPRVGEIWRCGIMARYEKIPFSKLLGTLFVDRIMDMFMVAIISLSLCVFNIGFFRSFFAENPPQFIDMLYTIMSSKWTYIAFAITIAALWYVFARLQKLTVVQKISEMFKNVWEGVKSLWKIKRKMWFFIQTLLIWGGYFLYFYITFFAFDFTKDLPIRIGLIAFAMSSLGVAVPVQGGIGVWHFMVISTLTAFGVNKTDAGAFALVVFTIQTIWIVLTGLFGIIALPIINRKPIKKA